MPRGEHPNSLANLVSWKPGQSGNPKGTKGKTLTTLLFESLQNLTPVIIKNAVLVDKNGNPTKKKSDVMFPIPNKERLIAVLLNRAASGDMNAMRLIFDRIDGNLDYNHILQMHSESKSNGIDWSKVPTKLLLEVKKYLDKE